MIAVIVAVVRTVQLSPEVVSCLAILSPLVVAALAKFGASSATKALLNAIIAAGVGAASTLTIHGPVTVAAFAVGIVKAMVYAFSSYEGGWKHLGVPQKISSATAGFGLGRAQAPAPPRAAANRATKTTKKSR